ncbi:YlxR family protein [Arthrobacter russicus]|uniref:YlxR family protein n=1 Tax=Arthrobacter russicus TaxID=172040 RepID=UPI0025F521F8|nr:YlxR family protein [Arthrobacter russicus]
MPLRTCIGCRRRDAQPNLLRVVKNVSGLLEADPRRRSAGRGAWLHPDQACFALAVKRHGFARAFKGECDPGALERYFAAELRTVQPESGSEN